MSIDNKQKLRQAIALEQAKKEGNESFVLLKKLDDLEDKIDAIKIPDNADIKSELKKIKEEIEQDLVIELNII